MQIANRPLAIIAQICSRTRYLHWQLVFTERTSFLHETVMFLCDSHCGYSLFTYISALTVVVASHSLDGSASRTHFLAHPRVSRSRNAAQYAGSASLSESVQSPHAVAPPLSMTRTATFRPDLSTGANTYCILESLSGQQWANVVTTVEDEVEKRGVFRDFATCEGDVA